MDHLQSKVAKTRLRIPIVYGVDAVHGNSNLYGATIFPHHVGLGATRNPGLVDKIGSITARETAGTGIRWAFSPAVSVCRDPRWGRCYESFSEDTDIVSSVAVAEVVGWQVQCSMKISFVGLLITAPIYLSKFHCDCLHGFGFNEGPALTDINDRI